MQFENKIVWITGASSGIGESLAYGFAKQKSHIILSSRNITQLERVKNSCIGAASVMIYAMDLSDLESVQSTGRKVLERYGRVDILINNAGISQRALARDTTIAVDQALMMTNYIGTIAVTKSILHKMLEIEQGHIVVVTSLVGKFGSPFRSSYAASKHALHGFFDSLRAEIYSRNIKITLVCPGFVKTNISLNALTGTGKAQNTMDEATENGLDPDVVASKIINAIIKEKEEVYIGGKETRGIWMKRFFPTLLSKKLRSAKVV